MDLVFNECSLFPKAPTRAVAIDRMTLLVETVRAARRNGALRSLRTCESFWSSELSAGYTIAAWGIDGAVSRESRLFVKTLAGRAPFVESMFAEAEGERLSEFCCGGDVCRGLGLALMHDWPALSVAIGPWRVDPLPVLCRIYVDGDEGASLVETDAEACNFFEPTGVERRAAWVSQRQQQDIGSGQDLLARANDVLDKLDFTKNAREQVASLTGSELAFRQVVRHLFSLADRARRWDDSPDESFEARLELRWSPESEATLNMFGHARTFRCPDGVERIFSLHSKIGVGAWRVHFLPVSERKRVIVGYVGPHLPTAR